MNRLIVCLIFFILLTSTSSAQELDTTMNEISEGDIFRYEITNVGNNENPIFQIDGRDIGDEEIVDIVIDDVSDIEQSIITVDLQSGGNSERYYIYLDSFSAIFVHTDWSYWERETGIGTYFISSTSNISRINNNQQFGFIETGTLFDITYELTILYDKKTGATTFSEFVLDSDIYAYELLEYIPYQSEQLDLLSGVLGLVVLIGGIFLLRKYTMKRSPNSTPDPRSNSSQSASTTLNKGSSNRFCTQCGTENTSPFCTNCGADLKQ